jgi:hypothetical protein
MGIIVIWENAFNLFSGFFGTKLPKKSTIIATLGSAECDVL